MKNNDPFIGELVEAIKKYLDASGKIKVSRKEVRQVMAAKYESLTPKVWRKANNLLKEQVVIGEYTDWEVKGYNYLAVNYQLAA
ncbi:MAG: hypothetical protein KME36_10890 [Candidatus Thiodiazotropha sp. (ex Lucina pensylvanica)]|nr:hypothetical protein [Candidatus Thiodiazotropha sp. (ex Lucina pensylvanica)]MBT3050683.1 hypothetical protein [Candidatus Thiodiazotropha sp. (ex Codakia orbicularis)]